jgi:two-component system chemotaxis sensor kinase CheA
VINEIFRAAHSMKGMAASMRFETLTELTHIMENALDEARNEQVEINTKFIDLLFEGIDYINELVDQIKEEGNDDKNINDYISTLDEQLKEKLNSNSKTREVKDDKIFSLKINKKDKKITGYSIEN